jgi:hypothetical protein
LQSHYCDKYSVIAAGDSIIIVGIPLKLLAIPLLQWIFGYKLPGILYTGAKRPLVPKKTGISFITSLHNGASVRLYPVDLYSTCHFFCKMHAATTLLFDINHAEIFFLYFFRKSEKSERACISSVIALCHTTIAGDV